jgi:hypothetical protein
MHFGISQSDIIHRNRGNAPYDDHENYITIASLTLVFKNRIADIFNKTRTFEELLFKR